jgi:hypothetical protein
MEAVRFQCKQFPNGLLLLRISVPLMRLMVIKQLYLQSCFLSRQPGSTLSQRSTKLEVAEFKLLNRELRGTRRTASSGILRRVALVRTDISVEHSASFIRVTRICELGRALGVTSNRRTLNWSLNEICYLHLFYYGPPEGPSNMNVLPLFTTKQQNLLFKIYRDLK